MLKTAIALIISMLLMTSCQSDRVQTKTVIVYPALYFPKYPEPKMNVIPFDINGNQVRDNETEIYTVTMPYWYYQLIVDYKLDVDKAKAEYEAFLRHTKKQQ